MAVTYCDLKADGFVADLPVDHGGLPERAEEEELLHLACCGLETQKKHPQIWMGGVVVQHSPTSSSTDEVPLSKAPEVPTCSSAALRCPPLRVGRWSRCVHRLPAGSEAEDQCPPKRDNQG